MTDRAEIFEGIQLGVETTHGTEVDANKRLLATEIVPSTTAEQTEFGPRGSKYNTIVINNKEWTQINIGGVGSYTDIVYLLSSLFGAATITTPGGGTTSRQWVWNPSTTAPEDGKSYTLEVGSATGAEQALNAFLADFGMTFNRGGIEVSGAMLAEALTTGITITPTPTDIPLQPIAPPHVSIYLDTTAAGLGTTQLNRAIEVGFNYAGKYGPIWTLNRSEPSFAARIEKKPESGASMTLGADSVGMGLLTQMRSGATRFLRIECIGPIIEGAIPYTLLADFAVKMLNPGERGNEEGLLTIPWDMRIVHDPTWGQSAKFTVINTLTAL